MRSSRPNVYLAGAWVASDWPATMEAAVRSGVAAAEAAILLRKMANHFPTDGREMA